MSTYTWSIPTGKEILGSTKIKDADNHLSDTIDDLVDFVNGEGDHTGQGLTYDLVDKTSTQTLTNKTITGTFTGNITGDVAGNADTATALETARTISLTGDVTGSASFNGTANATITTTIADDSHNHTISNIDGLQTEINTKQDTLVSGTSIKTINGTSILGSGNLAIDTTPDSSYLQDTAKSLSTNGYQKLSNGLIIQWGLSTSVLSSGSNNSFNYVQYTVTYPIPFPNACFNITGTSNDAGGNGYGLGCGVISKGNSSSVINVSGSYGNGAPDGVYWYAIGY